MNRSTPELPQASGDCFVVEGGRPVKGRITAAAQGGPWSVRVTTPETE